MCILCIFSRWSRHIVAMVMPMVTLWAISQFLPQGFRFEINSPKLALFGVLSVSLSWFELVTPRLSAWRTRRISAQKERKRLEEQEAAKRRKKATRRCRNCFTAYKDQTPASGRFMCTFCGHVSKRPVLDPPPGGSKSNSSFSFSGSASEFLSGTVFLSASPKDWYDRASFVRPIWGSGRSWIGVGPLIDGASWGVSASWFGGSWPGSGLYFGNSAFGWPESAANILGDGVFGGERWFAGDSYSGVVCFVFRAFSQLLVFAVWVWSKLLRTESVEESMISAVSEDFHSEDAKGGSSYEPKDKRVRRKAEGKRLARLEKEHQEAEEKKQREEVAGLVEERRRQRVNKSEMDETAVASKGKVVEAGRKIEKNQEKSQGMEKVSCTKENENNQDTEKSTRKAVPRHTKPIQNIGVKGTEENVKAASTFFSRWSTFKSQRSAKNKQFPTSKPAAAAEKTSSNLLPGLASSSRPCKAHVRTTCSSFSSSNSSTKFSECGPSSMARTQSPWLEVLCHGTLEVSADSPEDTDIMQVRCKEPYNDKNYSDSNTNMDRDKFVSNIMTENAVSAFENAKDHQSADVEGLQGIDPYAGQSREFTAPTFSSNNDADTTTDPLLLCKGSSSLSQPSQTLLSSTSSEMSQIYNIDPLGSATSNPGLSDFAAKQSHDFFVVRPTVSSAMLMGGTGACLTLNSNCLPASESLEICNPSQIWEPKAVSVNQSGFIGREEEWHYGSVMNSSQLSSSSVDASLRQRDELDQEIHFDPEFYLPSSLFSFEENDCQQFCCGCHMPKKKTFLESDGVETAVCTWEELDVHYNVPPEFVDCITHSLMQNPVITADGHSYERSAITDWLKSHDTSPKTGEVLPPPPGGNGIDKTLRPNHILRCQILEFRERLLQSFNNTERQSTLVEICTSNASCNYDANSLKAKKVQQDKEWSTLK